MESKDFETTIDFETDPDDQRSYPIIRARFLTKFNYWIDIPLLFDTGADDIVLSREYLKLFTRGLDRVACPPKTPPK